MKKRDQGRDESQQRPSGLPAHTEAFVLRRREFLRNALLGGLGYGAFAGLKRHGMPGVTAFLRNALQGNGLWTMDATEIIADALRGGPSLLLLGQALADGATTGPGVFRVFYETSHDIRNDLYLVDKGTVYNPLTTLNFGAMTAQVAGLAQQAPAPFTIMNAWAYQLFTTGKIMGTTAFPGAPDKPALTPDQLGKISLIACVGLSGTAGIHQRANIPNVGTLEYAMLKSYANYSPIGSVSINNQIVDSSGGVNNPGTTVAGFLGAIDVPSVYMSREKTSNPVFNLDGLTGDKDVKQVRGQMIDAFQLLKAQLTAIQGYGPMSGQEFSTYGARTVEGLAGMMMFADLFQAGLATVGSVGMNSFDFHATDATRMPAGGVGNMLTETSQGLAGLFNIAQAAFAAKKDCIVHFTTCSNRNETWVVDDSHVSTLTFVIKGSGDSSPFKGLPQQLVLIPDGAEGMYAEGPGNGTPNYSGDDATKLGLTGSMATVGRLEAGIVTAAGKATGTSPSMNLESPPAKII